MGDVPGLRVWSQCSQTAAGREEQPRPTAGGPDLREVAHPVHKLFCGPPFSGQAVSEMNQKLDFENGKKEPYIQYCEQEQQGLFSGLPWPLKRA